MGRTQAERKAETRRRLLDAAAERFAAEGVEAVSVDSVAEHAERTSGALYAHFGSKAGLLYALLEEWTAATAAITAAEIEVAATLDDQLEAIWRTVTEPPAEGAASWVLLEHELWLYGARHPETLDRLAERYREIRAQMVDSATTWASDDGAQPVAPADQVPTLMIALLLGLEMQQRVDPGAVPDDLAVRGLRALVGHPAPPPAATGRSDRTTDDTPRTPPRRSAGSPQEKSA